MLSDSLLQSIEQNIDGKIRNISRVSGGSINQAAKISTDDASFFIKWNTGSQSEDMFKKEAKGLTLLKSAGTDLLIPDTIATGFDERTGAHYLIMEYLEQASRENNNRGKTARNFGQQLARLHQQTNTQFGLDYNNYIGSLPQKNTFHEDWITFFIEIRLQPLVRKAQDAGLLSGTDLSKFSTLYKKLPDVMPPDSPSLLHGDLWSGNYFFCKNGKTAIYDPAVYYGHREIELAFTKLFGGFSAAFYKGYNEVKALEPGFNNRIDYYNLYPLLVHVNLFGGGYVNQVRSIIQHI